MFRIFYLDRDPRFYDDLLSWLPNYCSLHPLNILDIEDKTPSMNCTRDVMLIDPQYTGINSDFLERLIEKLHPVPIIFISDTVSLPFVVSLVKKGAHAFLHKKKDKSMLIECIKNLLYQNPYSTDHDCAHENPALSQIVGSSPAIRKLKLDIIKLSSNSMNIHLSGETGTGKELAARAIHSCRIGKRKRLIPVNCGAITQTLIESELFGTRKGAYTDAMERAGLFESADGSTIMLDEITEMPRQAQVKLLRVLEYGTFNRLGDTKEIKSDFQLITATNRDLREEVCKGRFREDLFYRITSLIIRIPPLRERKEDIGELSTYFLKAMDCEKKLTLQAMKKLTDHNWPGNIRELKQVMTRAEHLAIDDKTIDNNHIVYY